MEQNKTLYPVGIRLLSSNAIVLQAVFCPAFDSASVEHWSLFWRVLRMDAFGIPNRMENNIDTIDIPACYVISSALYVSADALFPVF